jgi:hypothetical protein
MGMSSGSSEQSQQQSSQSQGVPVNLQNAAYTGMAPGVSAALASIFQSGPNGISLPGAGYSAGYPAGATGVTPLNNALPGQVGTGGAGGGGGGGGQGFGSLFGGGGGGSMGGDASGGATAGSSQAQDPSGYTGSPAGYAIPGGPGGFFSPFQTGGVSSGSSQNPLAAQITNPQNAQLGNIGNLSAPQNVGGGVTPGSSAQGLAPFLGQGYSAATAANIPQAASTMAGFLNPNFASNLATSPQTQAAIGAATAPLEQSFRTNTTPGLASAATQAGQRANGPGQAGSSAFDQAFSNAQGNLMAQEGQVAGGIANQAYQAGININANAPAGATALAGQTEQQQMAAQQQPVAIGTAELNNMIQSLSAQALPQLTQQYGINQGLNLFNTQIQTIMQALGYGAQASQPSIAYNTESSGQGSGHGSSQQSGFNFGLGSGFSPGTH